MKVIHTSDLHIGKQLLKHKLNEVHQEFFEFLIDKINENNVDLLLISGDIFDTRTPSTTSQKLFYQFLVSIIKETKLKDVVIISGNHDSKNIVSLVAPLLSSFNIHVITSAEPEKQLIQLKDQNNIPYCQILAVTLKSYNDLRHNFNVSDSKELESEIDEALKSHFKNCEQLITDNFDSSLPIIGLSHLFTTGSNGEIEKGDGVREIYVGKLNSFNCSNFPPSLDYLALGHIHKPQIVNKDERFTYCGSPINLGFGETSKKGVVLLDFKEKTFVKSILEVPKFISLFQAKGDSFDQIIEKIVTFEEKITDSEKDKTTYLEIIYSGLKLDPELKVKLEEFIKDRDHSFEILSVKIDNKNLVLRNTENVKALNMLSPKEIFNEIVKDKLDESVIGLFDVVLEEIENEN